MWAGIAASLAFTGLIALTGKRLDAIPHLPDQGASWYYWKLPLQTTLGQVSAWLFYAMHQLALWGLIYYAQRNRPRYSQGLHPVNLAALGINAFFILLHLAQTHLWYDGLAQDVSIWSSQASVVLMLVVILLMENRRRGLFFGKKVRFSERIIDFARRYHGYLFAWGIIYTFWYHPMEATAGHLIGFFYMFLLMLQGSLFFTRIHVNRLWGLTQEVLVAIHGTIVAVMNANGMWPMFFFGFMGIFVVTQMYGLRLIRRTRTLILAAYILAALGVYSQRSLAMLHQVTWIPLVEYLAVFLIAGLIALGLRIGGWVQARSTRQEILPANG